MERGGSHETQAVGYGSEFRGCRSGAFSFADSRSVGVEYLRRRHGFAALGAADGRVKNAILGGNNARLYAYTAPQRAALANDRIAEARAAYERDGTARTNLAYGFANLTQRA